MLSIYQRAVTFDGGPMGDLMANIHLPKINKLKLYILEK